MKVRNDQKKIVNKLWIKWVDFCLQLGVRDNLAWRRVFNEILTRHLEPHRAYHGPKHINMMVDTLHQALKEYDRCSKVCFIINVLAVEFANWTHDAVYSIGTKNNEEASAEFSKRMVKMLGLPNLFGEEVAKRVRATDHFNFVPTEIDDIFISQQDLLIFAQPWDVFQEYDEGIRVEYNPNWELPQAEYAARRADVLEIFYKRDSLFTSEPFKKFEKPAKNNLTRAIAQFRKQALAGR